MTYISGDFPAAASRVLACFDAEGATLSGARIAAELHVSRTAVWKQIRALRAMGYGIESLGRRGYRLTAAAAAPLPTEVLPRLRTATFGRCLHYRARTASTNLDLERLAAAGAPEGTVVVAETQSAGRGRLERGWFSPPGGGLYFSLLLRPAIEPARATSLPLILGLAVAETLERCAPGVRAEVKWPNDILVGGRKICGILCALQAETDRIHHIVAGIGINVGLTRRELPAALRRTATSLRIAAGVATNRAALLADLLLVLEEKYLAWRQQGLPPFLPALRARDALFGRAVEIERAAGKVRGRADGVEPDGALRLRLTGGRVELVCSGDAHLRGATGA
jgi:BirA family biotin operon repressor/biotin-[acetyl-CoA-carboxylase] ligase